VARWAICWLLLIVTATAGVYGGTRAMVRPVDQEVAFQPLDKLGSPACTRASRALVAAGDGAAANASSEARAEWDRAAHTVLQSCASA
jgi:hypothetical protein